MKYYFLSKKFKNPVVVLKSLKIDRDGNVLQEGEYARFENYVFVTDNKRIADALRKLPNFGADYAEMDTPPVVKNDVEVVKMPSEAEESEQKK